MKTQGAFKYKVNGENKTKEEIDNMDLSNMNCTVENLSVSYSFPAEKIKSKILPQFDEVRDIDNFLIFAKELSTKKVQEETLERWLNNLSGSHKKENIRTKTEDELKQLGLLENLAEKIREEQGTNSGILKGEKFPYDFIEDFNMSQKDDVITNSSRGEKEMMSHLGGIKESQSTEKAPIFTYCKVNKNALEALSLRALYGHKKYNINGADEDWQNFTRVPNAEEEYSNAQFRHALEIGGEETEKEHLVSAAWNAVAKLEIYLRKDLEKSK